MKIDNVDLPSICKYYIAERYMNLLKKSMILSDITISGDVLHCNIKYDESIFYVLKTILDKTEKITIGDMLKYEYELDIGSGNDGHIFTIHIHGEEVPIRCFLYSVYSDQNLIKMDFGINH